MRKIEGYLMEITVVTSLYREEKDQKEFIESLVGELRFMQGLDMPQDEIDRAALDDMRKFFKGNNSKIGAGKKV